MTDEKWQKVKVSFNVALQLKPTQRLEYVKSACGDDVDLFHQVESLLANSNDSDSFLEHPAVEEFADVIVQENKSKVFSDGEKISHYKIISGIGAGGMGEVYLAQDTTLNRKVALKLLPSELTDDPDRLKRFEQEAFAISALNHPYILTIHEFGKNQDGTHFIATEYVEGETLNEYCESDKELDITSVRLKIVLQL